ncbi:MAG: tetratricopeptide repeat protein, partial [Gammaproteobacteria bacterium]|nr:tetratricopeptide repeat protein [Gammaproteobacteria bacterium]
VIEQFYEQEDVVQALIEENFKRLDDNTRRVIEALAVFKRPVPSLAVDYLLEPFVPGLDVPGIIRRLAYTNIVSIDRAAKTVTLHPIDQDYAYSQLPEEEAGVSVNTRQALERRAADYYLQLRKPEKEWIAIDDLTPQLVEIEHRIRAGDYDGSCQVMKPISDYLYRWGYYRRLAELGEKFLGNLIDPDLQATNLRNMGGAYHALGKIQLSIECYEQALTIARETGNRQIESFCLSGLSRSYRGVGQIKRAINCLTEALIIARETGDLRQEAGCLGSLGIAYGTLGQIEQALEHYEGALSIVRELDDRQGEGVWLSGVCQATYNLGQTERGISLGEEGLAIAREFNNRWIESYSLAFLGYAHYAQGQIEQAIKFYEQALKIFREIGNPRGQYQALLGVSKALLASEGLDAARQCCLEASALERYQISYPAELVADIVLLHQRDAATAANFIDAIAQCRTMVNKTPDFYFIHYALATALAGQAVCNSLWIEESKRLELLTPSLAKYQHALEICDAPGVVQDAIRD